MKQLVNLLLLAALVISVSAAPSIVTNSNYQAEVGQYRNTSQGGLEVRDYGNTPAGSSYNGTPLMPLYVKTSTPSAGDFAICEWDLGITSLPPLYTLKVSVQ